MKFRKEYSRTTMKNCPLMSGQSACKFIEDKKGKDFSELVDEMTHSINTEDYNTLLMKNIIYFDIKSNISNEDYDTLIKGQDTLDMMSLNSRLKLVGEDTKKQVMESGKRPNTFVTIYHLNIQPKKLELFNYLNLDLSKLKLQDLESNFFNLINILNSNQPKTIILSKDVIDQITDKTKQVNQLLIDQAEYYKNIFTKNQENLPYFIRSL